MNDTGFFIAPAGLRQAYPSHAQWSGTNRLLSEPECQALIDLGAVLGFVPATIGDEQVQRLDRDYRCVDVATLPFEPRLRWLYERLSLRASLVNQEYYGFDLAGLLEPVQLLRYTAKSAEQGVAGHYRWHQDFGNGYMGRRKLSLVVQLSGADDYEGCLLTLMSHQTETMNYRARGEGVCFPSWTPHCVSPIERGVRYALVAWVHGSPFR